MDEPGLSWAPADLNVWWRGRRPKDWTLYTLQLGSASVAPGFPEEVLAITVRHQNYRASLVWDYSDLLTRTARLSMIGLEAEEPEEVREAVLALLKALPVIDGIKRGRPSGGEYNRDELLGAGRAAWIKYAREPTLDEVNEQLKRPYESAAGLGKRIRKDFKGGRAELLRRAHPG